VGGQGEVSWPGREHPGSRWTVYTGGRYNPLVRLQEPSVLILAALTAEPLHGYGVMRAVKELSEGEITLRAGTLYAALDRLSEEGLLAVDREEVVGGRLRRYYRMTDERWSRSD
jgi:DNA-binding PadR family transcriptional regulator